MPDPKTEMILVNYPILYFFLEELRICTQFTAWKNLWHELCYFDCRGHSANLDGDLRVNAGGNDIRAANTGNHVLKRRGSDTHQ